MSDSTSTPIQSASSVTPPGVPSSAPSDTSTQSVGSTSATTGSSDSRTPIGFQNPSENLSTSTPSSVGGDQKNDQVNQDVVKENKVISAS